MVNRLSLPQGVKDFTPQKAEEIRRVEEILMAEFARWGYRRVVTPLFEYLEAITVGLGDELKQKIMKFVDPSTGDIVALRPDITPQVGRIVATQLRNHREPLRLCYNGRVVRFEEKGSGKEREIFQVGCELIGSSSPESDSEIIALATKSLIKAGSKELVLDIGHTGLLTYLLSRTGGMRVVIEDALKKKDYEQLVDSVKRAKTSKGVKTALLALPELYGDRDILKRAKSIGLIKKYVRELEDVLNVLDEFGLDCKVNIDLGELRGFNYYTGVTYEIISPNIPSALLRGGRYDDLIGRYGFDTPATGFAIDIESLLSIAKPHLEDNQVHFVIIPKSLRLRREAIRLAEWLRSSGFKVILDLNADSGLKNLRMRENKRSNSYGIIFLETARRIRLVESRSGVSREFSNLEELLKGGI